MESRSREKCRQGLEEILLSELWCGGLFRGVPTCEKKKRGKSLPRNRQGRRGGFEEGGDMQFAENKSGKKWERGSSYDLIL